MKARRVNLGARAAQAIVDLINRRDRTEKAERVNNARTGPGRVTLYALHKRIERPRVKLRQSPQFMLRQVRRKRRMLARTEAHLPFTAEGQAALRFGYHAKP